MPQKIRELKSLLLKAGFTYRPAKGSHTFWTHELLPEAPITIAGKDGDDAKPYLEKEVKQRLKNLGDLK
jgi:predicted RNA binding protein YcfA (HicA-like mRNA interferase family)